MKRYMERTLPAARCYFIKLPARILSDLNFFFFLSRNKFYTFFIYSIMNYHNRVNQFTAKDSVAKEMRNIFFTSFAPSQPYLSRAYQGELDGPSRIPSTNQEVSTVPYPTYSPHLAGRYDMNK